MLGLGRGVAIVGVSGLVPFAAVCVEVAGRVAGKQGCPCWLPAALEHLPGAGGPSVGEQARCSSGRGAPLPMPWRGAGERVVEAEPGLYSGRTLPVSSAPWTAPPAVHGPGAAHLPRPEAELSLRHEVPGTVLAPCPLNAARCSGTGGAGNLLDCCP